MIRIRGIAVEENRKRVSSGDDFGPYSPENLQDKSESLAETPVFKSAIDKNTVVGEVTNAWFEKGFGLMYIADVHTNTGELMIKNGYIPVVRVAVDVAHGGDIIQSFDGMFLTNNPIGATMVEVLDETNV